MSPTSPEQPTPLDTEEGAPVEGPLGLTFADGFQFGCGFMAAVTLSLIILVLALVVLVLLLSVLGLRLL